MIICLLLCTLANIIIFCRWHNMKDCSELLCMAVSAGAADLITSLQRSLATLVEYVSSLLLPSLLEQIAEGLDQAIFSDVS